MRILPVIAGAANSTIGGGGTTGLSVNLAASGGLAGKGGLAGIGGGLAGALTAVVLFIDRVEIVRYEFWC